MARKAPGSKPPDTLTRRQQLLSTAVSVVVGFIVMAATRNAIYGLVTFILFGIVVNAAIVMWSKR